MKVKSKICLVWKQSVDLCNILFFKHPVWVWRLWKCFGVKCKKNRPQTGFISDLNSVLWQVCWGFILSYSNSRSLSMNSFSQSGNQLDVRGTGRYFYLWNQINIVNVIHLCIKSPKTSALLGNKRWLIFGIDQSDLNRLQLLQNAAACLLTGTKKSKHITPVLSSLHWLPVRYRIDVKILLCIFKSL